MAVVKPFRAVRPREDLAEKIAALPYDVYTREEARKIVRENPLSFLKIDRAETQLEDGVDIYSPQVYEKAFETLQNMREKGEFIQEEFPAFYIYELTMNGRVQTGLGACVSVEEYEKQIIKKHENTRKEKEEDRTRHVEVCKAQTGPIFLAYRYQENIYELLREKKKASPVYDFISEDGIHHRLWVIDQKEDILLIEKLFQEVPGLYIADGHHRAASAVRLAQKKRKRENPFFPEGKKPEYEYFLAVLFADRDLLVMDYNRWVKDLNGKTGDEFLRVLKEKFSVIPLKEASHPGRKGQFTMYLEHRWYLLEEKSAQVCGDVVENLDVSLLQREVLCPLLGIRDPKTDQRIRFIGGIRGLKELERITEEQGGVAFALYPTSMEELFAVADEGKLMPPKSTWFEPKLRSGLLIHSV